MVTSALLHPSGQSLESFSQKTLKPEPETLNPTPFKKSPEKIKKKQLKSFKWAPRKAGASGAQVKRTLHPEWPLNPEALSFKES